MTQRKGEKNEKPVKMAKNGPDLVGPLLRPHGVRETTPPERTDSIHSSQPASLLLLIIM